MQIVRDPEALVRYRSGAFVPTMGALHAGHLALIRHAATVARPVIVSIFVNPTQFGPHEDLDRYPRSFDPDVAAAADAGAQIVFAPDVASVYPPGDVVPVPPLPPVATDPHLEDRFRPGHLQGVAQVVARLFDLVQPAAAVFGEKDYQQLLLIRALVAASDADRWPGLKIIGYPTVREPDGLAMSSRNAYLSGDDRTRALGVSRALDLADAMVREDDATTPDAIETVMHDALIAHDLEPEYAAVRNALTLSSVSSLDGPLRALIAARLGEVRLIDNRGLGGAS